ncbi:hypothetical protein BS47DRAFT_1243903, partial [Hydnum rufescens UP504]
RCLGLVTSNQQFLNAYFTVSSYKMTLKGKVTLSDLESLDMDLSSNMTWILEDTLTDLIPKTVIEYCILCQVHELFDTPMSGFGRLIPRGHSNVFYKLEIQSSLSGMPDTDVDDWTKSMEYREYKMSEVIQWSWRGVQNWPTEYKSGLWQPVTEVSR